MGILFPEVRTTSVRLIWQPPAAPNGIILGKPLPSPVPWLQVERGGIRCKGGQRETRPRKCPHLLEKDFESYCSH